MHIDIELAVEKSQRAQRFICENHGGSVAHLFSQVAEHRDGACYCMICEANHAVPGGSAGLHVWSPPCQPYSETRWTRGQTPCTGAAKQVPAFKKTDAGGMSPLRALVKCLEENYDPKAIGIVELNADAWMPVQRSRLLVCPK